MWYTSHPLLSGSLLELIYFYISRNLFLGASYFLLRICTRIGNAYCCGFARTFFSCDLSLSNFVDARVAWVDAAIFIFLYMFEVEAHSSSFRINLIYSSSNHNMLVGDGQRIGILSGFDLCYRPRYL